MTGEMNITQVAVTAIVTAVATGGVTGIVQVLSFRGMFGEFKRDIERRVGGVEGDMKGKVSKSDCEKTHTALKSDIEKICIRNDKEHDEMFPRIRTCELDLVAVRKEQLEG